jgi:release factor glutamine methyltransferase
VAPAHLRAGGTLLVVHSEVCGIDATLEAMRAGGLEPDVAVRRRGPLGPLMRARVRHLESAGLLPPGRREEDVVVLRGRAPAARGSAAAHGHAPEAAYS